MPKLVRDLIPDIMRDQNKYGSFYTAEMVEFSERLCDKLFEEAQEFKESQSLEELADLLEVIYTLAELKGHTRVTLEEIREKKIKERGGFSLRLIKN